MIQLRKFLASLLLFVFSLTTFLSPFSGNAVTTDGLASTWTREKAEHLGRRVLFYPTPVAVDALYAAGSASAAVDILFPSEVGPDRSQYIADLEYFTGTGYTTYVNSGGFNYRNASDMYRYYLYRYYKDPYEAKAKLSSLFEDIFSVNAMEGIYYKDVLNLHNLLYSHTLGNYKTLAKRVLQNNETDKGDYAPSQFLNLLRQYNKLNPNENYAREMLQLFLMDEYLPGESKDNNDMRNYSEQDVAAFAKILTGFWSDTYFPFTAPEGNVYFTGAYHNTSSGITFLAGNTGGVNYPFYDDVSDTIDLGTMAVPILGNNGLGDNAVDYVFSKRSHEIALFLAKKLFHFYVHENPDRPTLELFATQIETNNFDIFPSVKWLFTQDFFYADESMNALLYANPLELSLGLFRTLHAADPATFDTSFYAYSDILSKLGWTPYFPGSIFGRDGFDANYKWFSGYIATQWANLATTIVYDYTRVGAYQINNIVPMSQSGGINITMDEFLLQVEDHLILGRKLPLSLKNSIKTYLTTSETGATIAFNPVNATYRNLKYPGIFALVLAQPEFVLKSGADIPPDASIAQPSLLDSAAEKLIIVELPGGYDWMNGMISKSDFSEYQALRTSASGTTIAQSEGNLVDLGDYYMNPHLAYSGGNILNGTAFKGLYDSGYLKIFNRVGTEYHSRDHFQAQRQIASIDNSTVGGKGIIGELTQYETNTMNTLIMGTKIPFIYQGGSYASIGNGDNRIINTNPGGRLNTNQRNQQTALMASSFTGRAFPAKLDKIYNDSISINTIASTSVAQGGSSGVGYTTSSQLKFLKLLLENDLGKIFYLQNTGNGYDTHINELTGSTNLNTGAGKMANDITQFFLQVKDTQNITVVIYSEFGRTNAVNGTDGTDHGQGGGIFVLSSNPNLQSTWTGGVYGNMKPSQERDNWLSVGIDYRSVYGKILSKLYSTPEQGFFKKYSGSLDKDLLEVPNTLSLLRTEYRAHSNTQVRAMVRYGVEGENFNPNKGSYFLSSFGTGMSFMQPMTQAFYSTFTNSGVSNPTYQRIVTEGSNRYLISPYNWPVSKVFNSLSPFVYSITTVNNQYGKYAYTGSTTLPQVFPSAVNQVSTGSDSILRKYENMSIASGATLIAGSGIILANNPSGPTDFIGHGGFHLSAHTGTTFMTYLRSASGSRIWNGGFIAGELLDPLTFIASGSYVIDLQAPLSYFTIDRIGRVGADTLGVGIDLSQDVTLTFTGVTANTDYLILTSEDGISWRKQHESGVTSDVSGNLSFETDHFSLFIAARMPPEPSCMLTVSGALVLPNGSSSSLLWSTLNADTISLNQGIGSVGSSGSVGVSLMPDSTTIYTLTATNVFGSVECSQTIETHPLPTCNISVSQQNIKNGVNTLLTWTGTNTTTAQLLPQNIIVPSEGSLSVVPPSSTTTNYSINVENLVGSGSCNTSVTTYPNTAPIAVDDIPVSPQNQSTFLSILENDTDTDTGDILTVKNIGVMPSHGSVSISGTGILFQGAPGYCGSDSLSYVAMDQDGASSNEATVNVSISCGTNPPVTPDLSLGASEDTPITGTLTGTDIDGDTLSYILASPATHGTMSLLSNGDFTYTPAPHYAGIDTVTYYADDGTFTGNVSTITFTLTSQNDVPLTLADSGSTNMNTPTIIDVLANDSDPDHSRSELTLTVTTAPMSGSIIATGGALEYTPNTDFCGTDSFEYSVTDGSGGISNISPVSLSITCINDFPVANSDILTLAEDTSGTLDFLANDTDPDFTRGTQTEIISFHDFVTLPSHGTVIVTHSGTATTHRTDELFSYTPNPNFCGTDTFTYTIRDQASATGNTALVTLNVTCINDMPVAQNATIVGYSNQLLSGSLVGTDAESGSLIFTLVTFPLSGSASLSPTGSFTYKASDMTGSGTDSLSFRVMDGSGLLSNTGVVTFSLSRSPDIYLYTGSSLINSGVVIIPTGSGFPLDTLIDLNGRNLTATSQSGSLGYITLPGTLDILVSSGSWMGDIAAPLKISETSPLALTLSDVGVMPALPVNTQTMLYTYTPTETIKAGSTGASLALTGGYAMIEYVIAKPGIQFGSVLRILRSDDGNTWIANSPDLSCIVDNEMKCTFRTDHLTYFATVEQMSSPIVLPPPSVGPGGAASYYSAPAVISDTTIPLVTQLTNPKKPNRIAITQNDLYVKWIEKYQSKYSPKLLSEVIYVHVLRRYRTLEERDMAINDLVNNFSTRSSYVRSIGRNIGTLWNTKREWDIQRYSR